MQNTLLKLVTTFKERACTTRYVIQCMEEHNGRVVTMGVEEYSGSPCTAVEVVDLCGLPQFHLCCMLSVLYQGSFHWPTQCTHAGIHVAHNS